MKEILTLKEKAYAILKKQILAGDYKPGEFLTERTLVNELQMSRTPIREALERLVFEGLINHSPNQGLVIAELSLKKAIDIYDIRIALETHVVTKLSLRDWTDSEKDLLKINLEKQKKALEERNYTDFTILDSEFHKYLVSLYENTEIMKVIDNIQDQLQLIAIKVLRKDSMRIVRSYEDHLSIYEHIVAGDIKEAAELMEIHLEFGKQILIS